VALTSTARISNLAALGVGKSIAVNSTILKSGLKPPKINLYTFSMGCFPTNRSRRVYQLGAGMQAAEKSFADCRNHRFLVMRGYVALGWPRLEFEGAA
jgi:hypothetical protein